MAYQKKATLFILNCGPSMNAVFPETSKTAFQSAQEVLIKLLEEKVLAGRKTDMTSVILAGTEDTANELAYETEGQYQHITTLSPIMQPNLALLRHLANLTVSESSTSAADILDALILGIHIMVEHCRKLKYDKRIVIFTDAAGMMDWRDTEEIENMLLKNEIEFLVVGVGFKSDPDIKSEDEAAEAIKRHNVEQWLQLTKSVNGAVMTLAEAVEESEKAHVKKVRPTPIYRGFLTLGDTITHTDTSISISVSMYSRTMETRPPTAKKWSTLPDVLGHQDQTTHEVKMNRVYQVKKANISDEDASGEEFETIPQESLGKAYMFGKSIVTIPEEVEEFLKKETNPCMEIIGFIRAEELPREYLLGHAYVVLPGVHNTEYASMAISGLARGLYEKGALALVRQIPRKNGSPRLGILSPYFEPDLEVLHFLQVPFAEDVRQYSFRSLDEMPASSGKGKAENHSKIATPEMVDTFVEFIKSSNLSNLGSNGSEYLKPEETVNPAIWRYNTAIKNRALNNAAPIPDLHPQLQANMERVPTLVEKTKELVEQMKKMFDVKQVDSKEKKRRRVVAAEEADVDMDNGRATVNQILDSDNVGDSKRLKEENQEESFASLLRNDTRKITAANPIEEFMTMINNKKEDLVTEAVEQMCKIITQLVETSFGDNNFAKANECLKLLRETAAKEDESDTFNRYLYELKGCCTDQNGSAKAADFWKRIKKQGISLITNEEAKDSNVTPEEAEKFLTEEKVTKAQERPMETDDYDNMDTDDLLAML